MNIESHWTNLIKFGFMTFPKSWQIMQRVPWFLISTNVQEKNQYIDRRCFYSNDLEKHKKHQLFYAQEEGRILCCCSLLQKRKPTRVLHDQHRNASQKWENVVSSLHWPVKNHIAITYFFYLCYETFTRRFCDFIDLRPSYIYN